MEKNKVVDITYVIPVHNKERYLRQCLDSIVNNDIGSKEVIIIDDGSSDGSRLIIEEYSRKYEYIKGYFQKNYGVGAARNIGLCKAQGEYIAFVDADDILLEKGYKNVLAYAIKNSADIVFFGYEWFKDKTFTKPPRVVENNVFEKIDSSLMEILIKRRITNNIGTKIYKRKLLAEKTRFNESMTFFEDIDFCIRMINKAKRLYFLDQPLYYYRKGVSKSLSNKKCNNDLHNMLSFWRTLHTVTDNELFNNRILNFLIIDSFGALINRLPGCNYWEFFNLCTLISNNDMMRMALRHCNFEFLEKEAKFRIYLYLRKRWRELYCYKRIYDMCRIIYRGVWRCHDNN